MNHKAYGIRTAATLFIIYAREPFIRRYRKAQASVGPQRVRDERHLHELRARANLQPLTTTQQSVGNPLSNGRVGFCYEPLRGPTRVEASLAFATYPQRGTPNANFRSHAIHSRGRPGLHTCRRRVASHTSPERGFIKSARSIVADVTLLTTVPGLLHVTSDN